MPPHSPLLYYPVLYFTHWAVPDPATPALFAENPCGIGIRRE